MATAVMQPLTFASNPAAAAQMVKRTFDSGTTDQFKRELVKNGFQAGATQVEVTVCRVPRSPGQRQSGIKRVFVDNGHGMSREKLPAYIGELFAGESVVDESGANFQMGARVSTLPFNPAGFIVASWTEDDPEGSLIEIKYDSEAHEYGMVRQYLGEDDLGEDVWSVVGVPPAWMHHPIIKKAGHGTVVILMGDSHECHTAGEIQRDPVQDIIYPTEISGRDDWHYFNSKWWEIPEGAELRVIWLNGKLSKFNGNVIPEGEIVTKVRKGEPYIGFRSVMGVKEFLYKYQAESSGSLRVVTTEGAATIHWALYPNESKSTRGHQGGDDTNTRLPIGLGLFGELHGDEVYNVHMREAAFRMMEWYGIDMKQLRDRLVLIVEPDPPSARFMGAKPSSSRKNLILAGRDLPHREWGEAFAKAMPQAIRDRRAMLMGEADDVDHEKWQKNLRKELNDFFGSAYRKSKNGTTPITDDIDLGTTEPRRGGEDDDEDRETKPREEREGGEPRERDTGRRGGMGSVEYGGRGKQMGQPYNQRPKTIEPYWRADQFGDDHAGEVAYLTPGPDGVRHLILNPDHKLVQRLVEKSKVGRATSKHEQIEEIVRETIAQYLIGTILSIELLQRRVGTIGPLRGEKFASIFTRDDGHGAMLTALVANPLMLETLVNRQFQGRRGFRREEAVAV